MRNRDGHRISLALVDAGEGYCRWVDAAFKATAEQVNISAAARAKVHAIRHIGVSRLSISRPFRRLREHITAADRSNKCTTHLGGK